MDGTHAIQFGNTIVLVVGFAILGDAAGAFDGPNPLVWLLLVGFVVSLLGFAASFRE
ncbi:MAG: hypothetical protein ABEJ78_12020 [Haloferacaceae archaeon]